MKQLTIISGKGGTGKTTLVASLAALAQQPVLVDCDVDAADLHLLLRPQVKQKHDFFGGSKAVIDSDECTRCGVCAGVCRYRAISPDPFRVDPVLCEGCGVCVDLCPVQAIHEREQLAGRWYESSTAFGPMMHAELFPGQDNSGKLVAEIRKRAVEVAAANDHELVIVDGPPGVGCPVISALTGVDAALLITEPSPSGLHDLERVLELTRHFDIQAMVAINKADLAPDLVARIRQAVGKLAVPVLGELPYDTAAVAAMVAGQPVVTHSNGPLATAIDGVWRQVRRRLGDRAE